MGDLDNSLKVRHVVARVANALNVDSLGLVIDGGRNVLGLVAVDELSGDAKAGKEDLKLIVSAAVEVGGGDNVIARVRQRRNGHELRCLAGRGSHSSNTALKRGDPLLEDVDRGTRGLSVFPSHSVWLTFHMHVDSLHDAGVDVAELLEPEEAGAVSRVIEDIAL